MNNLEPNHNRKVIIWDSSLRDGNHAVHHQLSLIQIANYAKAADQSGVSVIEVGHGNGIGASSLQIGESLVTDHDMLCCARKNIKNKKLAVHCMPGFATINKDIVGAIEIGVDIFRIASHCTEADITQKHIEFIRNKDKLAYGTLMMSHMNSTKGLVKEALKMESYGASAIVIMDSAGVFLPTDVMEKITALTDSLKIPIGFHAHNNLGMAIANSVVAFDAGANIIDGTIRGFGAGAGNAQLEVLVAVLEKKGVNTGIDLYNLLDIAEMMEHTVIPRIPTISNVNIVSGLAGVFSGFDKHVERIAKQYNVDYRDIFFELGKKKVVGGQEDIIVEVAMELLERKKK